MNASADAQTQAQAACRHCGTAFTPNARLADFCCAGCQFVFRLIQESGLNRFYDLKGDQAVTPVKSLVFQERDTAWLLEAAREAETRAKEGEKTKTWLDLDVQGISCVACVWLMENIFNRQQGGLRCDVNAHLGQLRIWWKPGAFDFAAFAHELQQFGYVLGPFQQDAARGAGSRELVLRLGLCAAFALNAMAFTLPRYLGMAADFEFAELFQLVAVFSATLGLLVGGSFFIRRAWMGLRRGMLHIDLPISLGILFAYTGSVAGWLLGAEGLLYFDFVAVFIFLMLLGRWVQEVAVEKNRNRLLAGDMKPGRVTLYRDGDPAGESVEIAQVNPGDVIGVDPGRTVPVSGALWSGEGELSLEWINGEPEARHWKGGSRVPAGAVNISRKEVRIRAAERYEDSLLARLTEVTRDEFGEDQNESNREKQAGYERILKVYLVAVLGMGLCGGLGWLVVTGDVAKALQVAISVLVISCPCALGIALPMADEMAVMGMRKAGLFVRTAGLWRRLAKVRRIVFDKTGTLTLEVPELENPEVLDGLAGEERSVLAALVFDSLHPFSRALREALSLTNVKAADGVSVDEVIGKGVETVTAEGDRWRLGRADWTAGSPGTEIDSPAAIPGCRFIRNDRVLAEFHFGEALRPEAAEEIRRLGSGGKEVCILSGDRDEKVGALGEALGLRRENCHGGMTPGEKAAWMATRRGSLYVGDGANDSLAFGESDCSGTPAVDSAVLQRKADFYFLGRGLGAIGKLFEMARLRRRAVLRVFAFSVAYNLGAAAVCLSGGMSPLLAAVLMPVSSLVSLGIVVTCMGKTNWKGGERSVVSVA